MTSTKLSPETIREAADAAGFDIVRFGPADPGDHGDRFAGFWSNTLSPLYAFVLLSLGQTVIYAAVAFSHPETSASL